MKKPTSLFAALPAFFFVFNLCGMKKTIYDEIGSENLHGEDPFYNVARMIQSSKKNNSNSKKSQNSEPASPSKNNSKK